jgi:DNA-binding transcriptional LysR family regulator
MQAFVRVVEAGSFTRAADTMAVPKPTVTRLIQMLESHLQTRLLNRTTRRVSVTPDGAAYYEQALHLIGALDDIESSMSHAKTQPRGRLRVEVSAPVAQQVLIPALPQFYARYPDIQIQLGVSDRPVDLVGENVDCALRVGVLTDPSLVARRIGNFHLVVCAAPIYLKRHGVPLHPRDIEDKDHTVVSYFSYRTGRARALTLTKDGERIHIQARHRLSVDDANAALAAGLAGLGIIRTATLMAQPHIEAGRLQPLLLDWCAESIPLHVVYPPNRHLSAKVRVFVDWVAELFAGYGTRLGRTEGTDNSRPTTERAYQ